MDRTLPLLVEINTEGGAVSEGVAIFNMLSAWPGGVETRVVGWALSAGSLIAMAGRKRSMHETSLLMLHAPWISTSGNANELRETADTLDQVSEAMRRAYARTGQPKAVIDDWLDGADHWFVAEQALQLGLVTEVIPADALPVAPPANARASLHRVPSHLLHRVNAMTTSSAQASNTQHAGSSDAILAADARRRTEIKSTLRPLASRFPSIASDIEAILDEAESNPRMTLEQANQRALAALARGAEPLGQGARGALGVSAWDADQRAGSFMAACTDALLIRAGLPVREPHPALRDVQRMSVVAMAEQFLSMAGQTVSRMSRNEIVNAALSTSDFGKLLANVAGKSLRQGYEEAPATHVAWTADREVTDFKPQTLALLSSAPDLMLVPEGAEYKRGALSDSASEFTLATFGRIVSLTRQAIINDDLGAFTNLPAAFGAAARRLEADRVYALLTSASNLSDGAPLFHASRGNLAAAGAALSVSAIGAARAAMRRIRGVAPGGSDKVGAYIDPQPRFLLVPVALEAEAESIINSLVDFRQWGMGNGPNQQLAWVKSLTVVADPRLDAISETAWYLATAPSQIEGITRAYLQGEDRPYLEENDEFVRDAISYKTRLDFAAGVVDPRGLYKNPGA